MHDGRHFDYSSTLQQYDKSYFVVLLLTGEYGSFKVFRSRLQMLMESVGGATSLSFLGDRLTQTYLSVWRFVSLTTRKLCFLCTKDLDSCQILLRRLVQSNCLLLRHHRANCTLLSACNSCRTGTYFCSDLSVTAVVIKASLRPPISHCCSHPCLFPELDCRILPLNVVGGNVKASLSRVQNR